MKMKVVLLLVGLTLMAQRSSSSSEKIEVGCKLWDIRGDTIYCDECHAGNRRIKIKDSNLNASPEDLCKPCDSGYFMKIANDYRCTRCTECIGVQVHLEDCTAKSDTKCGCGEGWVCGDHLCSFCAKKCEKGFEPNNRSCRPCPDGTYNDKSHQKCKPWNAECFRSDQRIVTKGNATSDTQCVPVTKSEKPADADPDQAMPFLLILMIASLLMLSFGIIVGMFLKLNKKEKKQENPIFKKPIIRPPTDEPRTLVAVESSFNEAQQEQGNSTESLISKEPVGQLFV